jgi:hypothetical protein
MRVAVVRYKTKPERAEENVAFIEKVFAELNTSQPAGLQYTSLRLADGVSFVHVAFVNTDDDTNPLTATAAFGDFIRDIAERCEEPPVASDATVVGAYGIFTGESERSEA